MWSQRHTALGMSTEASCLQGSDNMREYRLRGSRNGAKNMITPEQINFTDSCFHLSWCSVYLDFICLRVCLLSQSCIKDNPFLCLSTGRGLESRPQWDQKPLLCEQRGAEGDVGEGQAQRTGDHALVQSHCRDLPLHVVGQPAEPQTVHGSPQNPPHVILSRIRLLFQHFKLFDLCRTDIKIQSAEQLENWK